MTLLSTWLVTVCTRTRSGQNVAGITGLVPFPLLPLDLSLIKYNCQEWVAGCVPLSFIGFLYASYIIIINGFYSRCFPVIQICTHRTFKLFFHTSPHAQYFSKLVILVLRKEVLKSSNRKVVICAISYPWVEKMLAIKRIYIVEKNV